MVRCFAPISRFWKKMGFMMSRAEYDNPPNHPCANRVLCCCTYVDNLFAVSRSLGQAIAILEDFEKELALKWKLSIKPRSSWLPRRDS